MQFVCPLCQQLLTQSDRRWHCDNRHSFDIAKQGYTNLIPVHYKKSKSPGDDTGMVAARSHFLNQGFYQPLSDHINLIVTRYLQQNKINSATIIDAGCGEGYYPSRLKNLLNETADITGIDISKAAVLAAAKRSKNIQWFVANSNAIPVANNSTAILLSLFAPTQAEEFHRCLQQEGLLLLATTGKQHLIELRELVYDTVNDTVFDPTKTLEPFFKPQQRHTVNFTIELNDTATIKNLFAMTPHYWRVSPERKTLLDTLNSLSLTVDIHLHCFQAT
jgi:23S rRNA (guanine745-N1)-methyltransferase